MTKIAVIGGGLSGLTAAHFLKDHADVTVFEKARGVSGRMSTRRADPYFFDHGAQYFTARTQPFQDFIQPLIKGGVIERWNARYVRLDENRITSRKDWETDEPRYVGIPGMNAVAKHLATDLDVRINTRVATVKHDTKWQLHDKDGAFLGEFDWVISTAPAQQTVELLPSKFRHHDIVKSVKMRACYSLMLGFTDPLILEFDAADVDNCDLSWIAVNSCKPGREDLYTLMVHSSEDYAQAHINDDRDGVMQHLCAETSRIIGHDVSVADCKTVHGWLYANTANRDKLPVLIDTDMRLGACGDWCQGGRVEGAFTAAYILVEQVKERLS